MSIFIPARICFLRKGGKQAGATFRKKERSEKTDNVPMQEMAETFYHEEHGLPWPEKGGKGKAGLVFLNV